MNALVEQRLSYEEVDFATRIQILDEAVWILHCAIILGISMNPTILPSSKGK